MLTISGLSFRYDAAPVLQNINLTIQPGEFVGVIGPNGSGKSTLLKIINGLIRGYEGSVRLQEREVAAWAPVELARQIAYVPQSIDTGFEFTVRELVETGRFPHQRGWSTSAEADRRAVAEALRITELEPYAERPFRRLSGGEQQRAVIAAALAQQSPWMLLDEPSSALDLHHQQEIYTLLSDLSRKENKTIVVITHDINLAAQYCQRLILMNDGRLLKDGPPKDVLLFPIIEEVYGVKVYIDINPMNNSLYIVPYT
ncbi:MAG: ABC transporter ATP-binding protein [Calditrichaeota bacterium]|nr:MAG: ABC transporter ATP-binding protein [Calditrichota bacterium]